MSDFHIPSEEVIIENESYRITAFLGTKSVNLCGKVMKIVGPSLSEFFNETDDNVSKAVRMFAMSLGDQELAPLIKELLSGVTKDGKPVNLDRDFIGDKFAHIPQLLVKVCMFNWGSAFRSFTI